jgi:hypothetical protein
MELINPFEHHLDVAQLGEAGLEALASLPQASPSGMGIELRKTLG